MKNIEKKSVSRENTAQNRPGAFSRRKKRSRAARILLLAVTFAAGIYAALSSARIKHALLLRFGTPQTYMAYVETNYLLACGAEWKREFLEISEPFRQTPVSGAKLELQVNHLLSDLLAAKDISADLDFSGAAVLLLAAKNGEDQLFQAVLQGNTSPIASLDLLHSGTDETLYLSCPQAGSTALAFSTAQDDPLVLLLEYLEALLSAFQASVSNAVSSDPYSRLLPFLDAVRTVEMEHGVPLPVPDSNRSALRLSLRLSLAAALDTAAAQLAEIKKQPEITEVLLPCYEAGIRLLGYLAARDPADLLIRAYVDESGNVLGHEFFLLSGEEILFALTGLLEPDLSGGKSGELVLYSALGEKPLTLSLSVSGFGFNAAEGGITGKVNASLDRFPSINFQFLFSTEKILVEESAADGVSDRKLSAGESAADGVSSQEAFQAPKSVFLPKLTLRARSLGFTVFTLTLTPVNAQPQYFPSPKDYTDIYRLSGLFSFVQSLDFSKIAEDFYKETGVRLSSLAALFRAWQNKNLPGAPN